MRSCIYTIKYPKVDPADSLTIDYTPDRIERGAYLANHVTVCMDCHSVRDFSEFSGPPAPGTLGAGGDRFDHGMGLPGVFYAKTSLLMASLTTAMESCFD